MRRPPEAFEEQDLTLLHVARKLRDALRLEQLLTDAGLDYLVEAGRALPRARCSRASAWARSSHLVVASYGDASAACCAAAGFTPRLVVSESPEVRRRAKSQTLRIRRPGARRSRALSPWRGPVTAHA